ncbi:hypothetical protein [Streptomyces sp. NPDC096105]
MVAVSLLYPPDMSEEPTAEHQHDHPGKLLRTRTRTLDGAINKYRYAT